MNWHAICREAEKLAEQFARAGLDATECTKLAKCYAAHGCSEDWVARYLHLMSSDPPPRSRKSAPQYSRMRTVWLAWRTPLRGREKAIAWGWAARLYSSQRQVVAEDSLTVDPR